MSDRKYQIVSDMLKFRGSAGGGFNVSWYV